MVYNTIRISYIPVRRDTGNGIGGSDYIYFSFVLQGMILGSWDVTAALLWLDPLTAREAYDDSLPLQLIAQPEFLLKFYLLLLGIE